MENVGSYAKDSGTRCSAYWLETPRAADTGNVWDVTGSYHQVSYGNSDSSSGHGVRPVITVKTSDIFN